MKHDDFIRKSLNQNLSGLRVSRQQQLEMIDEITGGKKMKKKIPFSFALVAILVLMSVAALAISPNVFSYFSNSDARFGKVADQASNVTAAPVDITSGQLGSVNARIDSAYYDGQSLSVGFVIENSTRIEPYTPNHAELADAVQVIDPVMPLAATEEERRIMEEFSAAVENGVPYGFAIYTVSASDHTTVNGIDVPPYTSVQDYGENGEFLTIRSFESPLPEGIRELDSIDVSITLRESTFICYFDGIEIYHYSINSRDAGTINATVPRADAEFRAYTGSAVIEGITFTAEASLSAMNGHVVVQADNDVFGLVSYEVGGECWQAPEWHIAVFDENGYEFSNTEGYSLAPEGCIEIDIEGSGELPEEMHIYLLHAGEEPDTYDYWPVAGDKLDNPHLILTIAE